MFVVYDQIYLYAKTVIFAIVYLFIVLKIKCSSTSYYDNLEKQYVIVVILNS